MKKGRPYIGLKMCFILPVPVILDFCGYCVMYNTEEDVPFGKQRQSPQP